MYLALDQQLPGDKRAVAVGNGAVDCWLCSCSSACPIIIDTDIRVLTVYTTRQEIHLPVLRWFVTDVSTLRNDYADD